MKNSDKVKMLLGIRFWKLIFLTKNNKVSLNESTPFYLLYLIDERLRCQVDSNLSDKFPPGFKIERNFLTKKLPT